MYGGKKCFASGTAYGDGSYYDAQDRVYGVDAGLIGIMPFDVCDGDSMNGGNIVEFSEDFKVQESEGKFRFGNVIINTRDE